MRLDWMISKLKRALCAFQMVGRMPKGFLANRRSRDCFSTISVNVYSI